LKRVVDWRLRHKSWIAAMKKGDLRPNDFSFIVSMGCAILFLIILILALAIDV
jgi:hypothetical protein